MQQYKVGDKVSTKHGELTITKVEEVINPFSFKEETIVMVDLNGQQRKLADRDIIDPKRIKLNKRK